MWQLLITLVFTSYFPSMPRREVVKLRDKERVTTIIKHCLHWITIWLTESNYKESFFCKWPPQILAAPWSLFVCLSIKENAPAEPGYSAKVTMSKATVSGFVTQKNRAKCWVYFKKYFALTNKISEKLIGSLTFFLNEHTYSWSHFWHQCVRELLPIRQILFHHCVCLVSEKYDGTLS